MSISWKRLFLVLLVVIGCSEDPAPVIEEEQINIFFDSQSKIEIEEDDNSEIDIPIKISLSQEDPIVVTYETIGQEVVSGSDFTILSDNPLTIPAGSTQVSIKLQVNDNDIVQSEDRNIYIRIRSVDKSNVKTAVPKEVVISIKEDDCAANIPNVEIWIGDLTIQTENDSSIGLGKENASGNCSGSFNVTGRFVGSGNPESTFTIQLTQDAGDPTKGTASISKTKLFNFTSQYDIEAIGTYSEVTKKITLVYTVFDLNNSANNFTSDAVITAN